MQEVRLMRGENRIFLWVSLLWLALSLMICFFGTATQTSIPWLILFWGLSNLDLLVLAKLMSVAIRWMGSAPEKKSAYAIQAFCWGIFKVVSLGLFIFVLLKGYEIPTYGLLMGTGTLGIVPLLGGFIWSQRVLRNA